MWSCVKQRRHGTKKRVKKVLTFCAAPTVCELDFILITILSQTKVINLSK